MSEYSGPEGNSVKKSQETGKIEEPEICGSTQEKSTSILKKRFVWIFCALRFASCSTTLVSEKEGVWKRGKFLILQFVETHFSPNLQVSSFSSRSQSIVFYMKTCKRKLSNLFRVFEFWHPENDKYAIGSYTHRSSNSQIKYRKLSPWYSDQ